MDAEYDFRLLGPIEAVADGVRLDIGGPKQRAVLALLLLNANEVVPRERLIDDLWGEAPPPTARETLKVYVGRLRKMLRRAGSAPRLDTRGGGYELVIDPERIDLRRFQRLAETGSSAFAGGDAENAARLLRDALALWRGPPLVDLEDVAFVRGEQSRLEELRLATLENRVEADLALRRERELVPELERLVVEHPFREGFHAQLMLALYRSGRQVEALEHYRRTARLFADELGIEPGPELRARERAILEHDPALLPMPLGESTLPSPPDRLIGRERELAELAALLSQPQTRLVTLVGPGGSGKTRLAVETAGRVAGAASMPVYFVDLAPLAEPESVLPAVARTVGFEEEAATPFTDSLGRFLRVHRLLLVLDNFEHLLDAAADVAALLSAVPGLTVLVTSRSPLRVRGEWRYEVGPLRTGDAVALFVERARAIRRGFDATATVEELCRRLDALPLPIELAAARTDRLTPEAMLAALEQRFDLLGDGARDLPLRQRTLRATLDWSYELLDDGARDLLPRLAVFAGGCTPAAAARVCEATPDLIDTLADAALVRREHDRIVMLETLREYGLERLRASGGEDDLRRAHARYYTALTESAKPSFERAAGLATVAAEHDNIRAALRWSREARDVELHLRLLAAASRFWSVRGHLHEANTWLGNGVEMSAAAAPSLRASILTAASEIAGRVGDLDRAYELAVEAHRLWRTLGDERGAAGALVCAMMAASRSGDTTRREAVLSELELVTDTSPAPGPRLAILRALGATAARAGDHEGGRSLVEESLALARAAESELDVGQALCHLGVIALQAGRCAEAREPLEESLAIAQRLAYREAAAYSFSGLAALAVAESDIPRATQLLAAADALLGEIGTTRLPFISDLDVTTRAAILGSVGEAAFARAGDDARDATLDDLVARAAGAEQVTTAG